MDRCSEPASPTAPRTPRDLHWVAPSGSNRTGPTDGGFDSELSSWVFTKRLGFGRVAQPNGSRLSCGALKKDSFLNLRAPLHAPPARQHTRLRRRRELTVHRRAN